MTINVAKELGTRYVLKSYLTAFRKVFDDWLAKDKGTVFDLCDCRLSLQATVALGEYYGKANLINSKDKTLNMYLQENCRKRHNPTDVRKIELRPESYDVETISKYISSLTPGTVYEARIDYRVDVDKLMSFLCLLILTRPEITVDVGNVCTSICEFIRDAWVYKAKHHDAYWEVDGNNLIRREVVDGYISAPYRNEISEDMYRETFNCIPIEFGTEYLYESKEWDGVVGKALQILTKESPRPNLIKDFIETR